MIHGVTTGERRDGHEQPGDGQAGSGQPGRDAIAIIELELMKLVRHLETFGRRCSLYVRVDRAGYLAMRMLDALGPVSTNTLAHALHLDASTVTRQVTALEGQGFVERRANPADGRSSTIVLTSAGPRSRCAPWSRSGGGISRPWSAIGTLYSRSIWESR